LLTTGELEDMHLPPVDCVDGSCRNVTHCRNGKWEDLSAELLVRQLGSVLCRIEVPAVAVELATKSAKDHDYVLVVLNGPVALSDGDLDWLGLGWVRDVDDLPLHVEIVQRCLHIEPLNDVEVLLVLVADSAEDEDKFAVEFAAGMVVASMSEVAELGPRVLGSVIDLNFL
jgi:hypothetical protein